jgi:hypothetical protein
LRLIKSERAAEWITALKAFAPLIREKGITHE